MQEAFYHTNRVCTLSFHQFDPENNFFPGTGALDEIGEEDGQHCSINVPLKPGCTDAKFLFLFNKGIYFLTFHKIFLNDLEKIITICFFYSEIFEI